MTVPPVPASEVSSTPSPHRNTTIEGLRGVSAFWVLLAHLVAMPAHSGSFGSPALSSVLPFTKTLGYFGVVSFFMISGFLIVQTLVRHADLRRFFINRAVRIYPVFLVFHILLFCVGPRFGYEWMGALRGHPAAWTVAFLQNLFFLPGVLPLPVAQKNAWSLSFEFFFYLLAALGWVAYAARIKRQAWALPCALLVLGLSGVFVWLRPAAWFFVSGVAAYLLFPKLQAATAQIRFWKHTGPLWAMAMFGALNASPLLAAVLGFAAFVTISQEWGSLSRLLRRRVFLFLGRISYSLYLVHPFALAPLRALVGRVAAHFTFDGGAWVAHALFVVLGIPLCVGIAYLSYALLEVGLTSRFLRARTKPAPRPTVSTVVPAASK